jgi:hypothetical protein
VLAQPQQAMAVAAPAAAGLTVWSLARGSEGFSGGPGLDPCIDHDLRDEAVGQRGLGAEDSAGQQQWQQHRGEPVDGCVSGNWSVHEVPSRSRQREDEDSGILAVTDCQAPRQQQQQQQLSACSSSSSLPSIPSCAEVVQMMQHGQRHTRQQQGCQLPALRTAAAGSSMPLQQQQQQQVVVASSLPKVQQARAPQAAAVASGSGAADTAVQEAVWKAPPAAAKHAATPSIAASFDAPSLHSLVQQAAKVRERRYDSPVRPCDRE